jgi:hypothetical protein
MQDAWTLVQVTTSVLKHPEFSDERMAGKSITTKTSS